MDSKVVVGTGGSFAFVGGLADSRTARLATVSPFIHQPTGAAVDGKARLSCCRGELTSFSVPLLAC